METKEASVRVKRADLTLGGLEENAELGCRVVLVWIRDSLDTVMTAVDPYPPPKCIDICTRKN